jgi:hypothetical protein
VSNKVVEVRFGGEQVNFLSIIVRGRAYRRSRKYWDGNWLHVTAVIQAGKFSGQVPGLLRVEELATFYQRLSTIHESRLGAAGFQTFDRWLNFQVEAELSGVVKLSGTISDDGDDTRSQLIFAIDTDHTFLDSTLGQLQEALRVYPVYGKP